MPHFQDLTHAALAQFGLAWLSARKCLASLKEGWQALKPCRALRDSPSKAAHGQNTFFSDSTDPTDTIDRPQFANVHRALVRCSQVGRTKIITLHSGIWAVNNTDRDLSFRYVLVIDPKRELTACTRSPILAACIQGSKWDGRASC